MRTSGTRVAGTLLALSSLVVATSCSEDDTAPTAGGDIKIALFVNASGPLPTGEENAVPVAQAWADTVNGSGGIDDREVEIVVVDTKGDAPTATSAAREVLADESIVAGVMFDGATEGLIAEEITSSGLPMIGGMGYDPNVWGTQPNWLPLTTTIPSIFTMGMTLGASLDAHNVGMTICAEVAPCEAAEPIAQGASENLGLDYVGTYKISSSSPDYTAECLSIIDAGADYVMLGAATPAAALRLASDCDTQSYTGKWGMFGGVIVPKVMRENYPGVRIDLALNAFPWFTDEAPVVRYREMVADAGVDPEVAEDPHSTAAYATLELFRTALESPDVEIPETLTRDDIVDIYSDAVVDEDVDGLLAQPVTFNRDAANSPITCYWYGWYENGKFGGASLAKPSCDPEGIS